MRRWNVDWFIHPITLFAAVACRLGSGSGKRTIPLRSQLYRACVKSLHPDNIRAELEAEGTARMDSPRENDGRNARRRRA